jgi:hypothetical protein
MDTWQMIGAGASLVNALAGLDETDWATVAVRRPLSRDAVGRIVSAAA